MSAYKETYRDQIIEFLIDNQEHIKEHTDELKRIKNDLLRKENPVFIPDMDAQYDARIKQWIALFAGEHLALPMEYIIIELEKIDIEEYLNV